MALNITREDQYTLINLADKILENSIIEDLEERVVREMEQGAKNFILDMSEIENASSDLSRSLDTLYNIILKEDGILVVANATAEVEAVLMGDNDIVFTPTISEAVDYVFMEEIQKQLLEDEGEDDMED